MILRKNIILLCVLTFFIVLPFVVNAEISPQAQHEIVCKKAFNGEIKTINNLRLCELPSGDLCVNVWLWEQERFKKYKSCDDYSERICAKVGESTKFGNPCCEGLSSILGERGYKLNCEKAPVSLGGSVGMYCGNCGDLVCDDHESRCNCPEDCMPKAKPNPEKNFIISFFHWLWNFLK